VRVVANSWGPRSIQITASDCSYILWISIGSIDGLGSYSVENGVVVTFNQEYTGAPLDSWTANPTQGGSGSVTLASFTSDPSFSAASATGTFDFTLVRSPGFIESMAIRGSFDIDVKNRK
jgi:hypothetical protein